MSKSWKIPGPGDMGIVLENQSGKNVIRVMKEDDVHGVLKAGDALLCTAYPYDTEKLTVVRRLSDGLNPMQNVYCSQVRPATPDDVKAYAVDFGAT